MGFYGGFLGFYGGKRLHSHGKIHQFIAGKTHYFDWAIFKSYVTNYQRVTGVSCLTNLIHE